MKYTYCVSYSYNKGFGNMGIYTERKIDNMETIVEIQKDIEAETGIFGVVFLNAFLLSEDN